MSHLERSVTRGVKNTLLWPLGFHDPFPPEPSDRPVVFQTLLTPFKKHIGMMEMDPGLLLDPKDLKEAILIKKEFYENKYSKLVTPPLWSLIFLAESVLFSSQRDTSFSRSWRFSNIDHLSTFNSAWRQPASHSRMPRSSVAGENQAKLPEMFSIIGRWTRRKVPETQAWFYHGQGQSPCFPPAASCRLCVTERGFNSRPNIRRLALLLN